MVAPSATIELYVDGTRVPSTPGELAAGEVTALDNLRLTWGRDGQHEQPGPASVVFDLVDPAGSDDVLDVVHVGSAVDVWAEGTIAHPGSGFQQTMDDGSMDSWPAGDQNGVYYGNASAADTTVGPYPGRGQVLAYAHGGVSSASFQIPPRQFSPPTTLPNAWDDIPKYMVREFWEVRVAFRGPPGVTCRLNIAGWPAPYATANIFPGSGGTIVTATGSWQTIICQRSPSTGFLDTWLGLDLVLGNLQTTQWQAQPGTWATQTTTWADWACHFDAAFTGMPLGGTEIRRVLVFSGEISDLVIGPWGDRHSTGITVTAVDLGGQLGQTVVGDTPWAVQTVGVRANRVAQLAGITTTPRVRIDTPLDALQVSARDVDAQPAYQLLQDLAQSAGGVLWAATHAVTGPYLWIENPATRAAVRQLELSGGLIVITAATRGTSLLSACDLLEDGVTWAQDSADVVSVVAITWAEQGPPGDDGLPTVTERTVTVTDPAAVTTYGTRRLSISTELIASADATSYANRVLAQARAVGWRLDGLTLDTGAGLADALDSVDDATRQTALLDLLDGTTRMGAALTLVDMPPYAPRGAISAVYVDGGTYAYTGDSWALSLATTPSAGQGSSARWNQLDPAWRWNQWAPTLRWVDLYGVAA